MGVVERCPSGALQYRFGNGAKSERPPRAASVVVTPAGPLQLRGDLRVVRAEGGEVLAAGTRLALCRCGQSARKPFCDGAHAKAGFDDPAAVPQAPASKSPAGELPPAPALEVKVRRDGPLKLAGEFQFLDPAGRVLGSCNEAALCRCGASRNKPFCDGSHREAGFRAD
jgi:CDGSH-type Zn-finger protein